nr:uncharacterized protein LOC106688044 isoform X2 [Halyomorpha halys]
MSKLTASLQTMLHALVYHLQTGGKMGLKIFEDNTIQRIMASVKNFLSPALSNTCFLFPNKSFIPHGAHTLNVKDNKCCNEDGYSIKECQKKMRNLPDDIGPIPVPPCEDDKGVHSEIDMIYRKWDDYWPLYKGCRKHVRRIETYPAGTDPNSNNKL